MYSWLVFTSKLNKKLQKTFIGRQVLRVNSGATALEFVTPVAGGITEADTWRITTTFTSATGSQVYNTNWERVDTFNSTVLGTGMSEASGVFSFPSTGYYHINFKTYGYVTGTAYALVYIDITLNNGSTFDTVSVGSDSNTGSNGYIGGQAFAIVKITDIANQKVRFQRNSSGSITYEGDTNTSNTQAEFIKLAGI